MSSYVKGSTLEKQIQKQLKVWETAKTVTVKAEIPRPFITISREYGCDAGSTAAVIAQELNAYEKTDVWQSYERELIDKIVEDHDISEKVIETIDTIKREEINEFWRNVLTDYPSQVSVYQKLVRTVRGLSIHGRAIFVGRAGVMITRNLKYGLHLRFVAPPSYRIHKIMEKAGIRDRLEAEKLVERKDKERHDFLTQYLKFEATNPASYDLTINVARVSNEEIAQMVVSLLVKKGFIE
ncbi:MAG: cytidylate kinase-like family protein [Spirochaetes bacterium]|nr:MAG: cytidylate kinase-like family protein [Spirochaetota bacterium]